MPKGVELTHRALVSVVASSTAFLKDPLGEYGIAREQQQREQRQPWWDRRGVGPGISKGHDDASAGETADHHYGAIDDTHQHEPATTHGGGMAASSMWYKGRTLHLPRLA